MLGVVKKKAMLARLWRCKLCTQQSACAPHCQTTFTCRVCAVGLGCLHSFLLPARGHSDEWYQERCVFCCGCKETINSQFHKRGSRCHGCRRWFHTSCMPAGSSNSSSSAQQPGADGTVGGGSSSSSAITAAAGSNAAVAQPAGGQARQRQPAHALFFHSDDCKQVGTAAALL